MSEKILIGIPAAPGLAIGTAFIFRHDNPHIREYILPYEKREEEECRLKEALIVSESQLADLYQQILEQTNRAVAQIFEAQKTIMTDELFVSEIKSRVVNEGTNAEYAVSFVTDWMIKSFSRSTSDLLRQKTQDIRDVGNRLIRNLMGDPGKGFDLPNHPVVFIAANLLPSDIVNFQKSSIIGVGTDQGGAASHTAILTRSLNVPAVIGLKNISELAKTGDRIIINGNSGKVFLNPGNDTEISYQKKLVSFKKYISSLADIEKLPSTTLDGRRIKLRGNIEIPRESKFLNSRGADGVGLFRSEYIILTQKSLPDEAIQYNEYCKIIKSVSPNPVTIRTFDLGGDKVFPNLPHPVELNPFMGWRSIRVSLDNPEQLRTQLRAILRAGTTGKVKLMFPFVSGLDELKQLKHHLNEVKDQLKKEGYAHDPDIETGIMIELPSAVMMAEELAKEVDFFSIGTNDLTQFALAVDRGNELVSNLFQPLAPGLLRMIKMTVSAGHSAGISVGICGEIASKPLSVMLLVGLELDELSVSPAILPDIKKLIRSMTFSEAKSFASKILKLKTVAQINEFCQDRMKRRFADLPIWF